MARYHAERQYGLANRSYTDYVIERLEFVISVCSDLLDNLLGVSGLEDYCRSHLLDSMERAGALSVIHSGVPNSHKPYWKNLKAADVRVLYYGLSLYPGRVRSINPQQMILNHVRLITSN